MEKFADKSLNDFAAALASDAPTPGGGGAAALCGALAAALGEMVCNLTAGKPKYAEYEADIADAVKKLSLTRTYMLRLIDEDAKAFEPLRKYLALPKDDPARAEHMDSALRVACFIPTEVMYTAAQTAEMLRDLADKGVKGAISDVGVGLELCRAAMRASRLNILINAAGMTDEVFAMTLRRECELVFEQYGPVIDAGLAAVEARIG